MALWLFSMALGLALLVSLAAVAFLYPRAQRSDQLIAVSWGQCEPNGPPALYGAYVWIEGEGSVQRAMLRVYIDRPTLMSSYQINDRELGPVKDPEEAVALWGRIDWTTDGLRIGPSAPVGGNAGPTTQGLLVPVDELTRHR